MNRFNFVLMKSVVVFLCFIFCLCQFNELFKCN